jgi:hypothetical protein
LEEKPQQPIHPQNRLVLNFQNFLFVPEDSTPVSAGAKKSVPKVDFT